jgi:hypothetical protein
VDILYLCFFTTASSEASHPRFSPQNAKIHVDVQQRKEKKMQRKRKGENCVR